MCNLLQYIGKAAQICLPLLTYWYHVSLLQIPTRVLIALCWKIYWMESNV